jgi:signal transduction histidine kinase/ActR/RegA family two-component response regulator
LSFRKKTGETTDCRCEGAALRPGSIGEPALLILRCKLKESASSRSIRLKARIEELEKEITGRKCIEQTLRKNEKILEGQRLALEMIARRESLYSILEMLVRLIEEHSEDMIASILLLDKDGIHLKHGAAPSLPHSYNRAIEGIEIGPVAGSCGTAAYRKEPVIVLDIATDPLWADYRGMALAHGLRACWSTPIIGTTGKVLGTFAIYYHEPGIRNQQDVHLINILTRTAATVIERKLEEEEHEQLLIREQEARESAERASHIKDEFLATISHELRTPLTSMLGWVRLLRTGKLDKESTAGAIETIERNVKSQAQLIEDLLDISRITSGKLRLDIHPVDLSSVINSAVSVLTPAADAKGIRIQTILDSSVGSILGDFERLQQVVWNLLSNSIKFTPKNGTVQVQLERINSQAEITVTDTGQGIRTEFLPHVFERFTQEDSSISRIHGGIGMGLAIVKSLVELHGGTVKAESTGEGRGATFIIKLPIPVVEKKLNDPERIYSKISNIVSVDCPEAIKGLRILVADDEPDTCNVLKTILEQCGAEVRTALSVAEALKLFDVWLPMLLISDIGMPGETGYDLIRYIRARDADKGGKIPAIALTAFVRIEDRIKVLSSGFQMHVSKPVEPAELLTIVASLTGIIRQQ